MKFKVLVVDTDHMTYNHEMVMEENETLKDFKNRISAKMDKKYPHFSCKIFACPMGFTVVEDYNDYTD